MPDSTTEGAAAAIKRGHEEFELDTNYIGWFAAGLVVLLIATALVTFGLMGGFRVPPPPSLATPRSDVPDSAPVPVLQAAPAGDLRAYRQDKAAVLEGYGWVDRPGGIVKIPIERAMQLMTEGGGLPATPPGNPERHR